MTTIIKSETIGNKTIYIEQEKFDSGFSVGVDALYNDGIRAYNLNEYYYMDLAKAKKRFSYLKSQVNKGII